MANSLQKGSGGPVRLSVGSLHLSIAENILQVNPLAKWVENEGNPRWELENIGRVSVPLCSV